MKRRAWGKHEKCTRMNKMYEELEDARGDDGVQFIKFLWRKGMGDLLL